MSTIQPSTNGRKIARSTSRARRKRRRPGDVELRVEGEEYCLRAGDFEDDERLQRIGERCSKVTETAEFFIPDLLGLPKDSRLKTFFYLVKPAARYSIRFPDGQSFDDLFEAVLHLCSRRHDTRRSNAALRAALEAAAIVHPDGLPLACNRIVRVFRAHGESLLPQTLIKEAKSLVWGLSTEDRDRLSPRTAAESFIKQLKREATESPADDSDEDVLTSDPVLLFYEDDFFTWKTPRWCRTPDRRMNVLVAAHLQLDEKYQNMVTAPFIRDVLANLRALSLLPCQDESLPLFLSGDPTNPWCPSPYLVFQNGMLDIREAIECDGDVELLGISSKNFSTIALPYDFNPQAECPLWKETIRQILRPRGASKRQRRLDKRIAILQEAMGYSLLPRDTSFEKFLVLVGDGSNGKTTIFNLWKQLLGPENVAHVPLDHFSGEFRLDQMMDKLANIVADMNRMDRVDEGLLKMLVTGDPVQVNRKNKPPITMTPTAKLIFGTNNLPPINDRSNGVWRRLIAMPFFEEFSEEDRDRIRAKRLHAELPGIFNWALAGARRLFKQDRFTPCRICDKCLNEHRYASDPIRQFVDEECLLREGVEILSAELYEMYKGWCDRNGRKSVGSSEFGKHLSKVFRRSIGRKREASGKRRRFYTGIIERAAAPAIALPI